MLALVFLKLRREWAGGSSAPVPRRHVSRRRILCLVPIVLAGCQTTRDRPAAAPNSSPSAAELHAAHEKKSASSAMAKADANVNQTDFHRKVTKDQQYNVHLELGRYQEGQENFEFALAEYQKALEACEPHYTGQGIAKSNAQQAVAHRRMASTLDRLGQFDQSENHFRTALKLSPNDPKVWNDAGYSYYLQSRWADSERALKTADSLDPNNSRILTNLGLTLAASGKTNDALAAFTKAGGHAVGHANLAYILAAMGNTDLARKHYKTALEYQPELEHARVALSAIESQAKSAALVAAATPPAVARPVATPLASPVVLGPALVVRTTTPASAAPVPLPKPIVPARSTPLVQASPPRTAASLDPSVGRAASSTVVTLPPAVTPSPGR